jgi:hypothetical protein
MEAFAQRGRRELRAAGGTTGKRAVTTTAELTGQEAQIARLAADGLSNPGDRHPAVPKPAHRPVPPAQGPHQAGHHLTRPAQPSPPSVSRSRAALSSLRDPAESFRYTLRR